jgi:hypothetical protein
VVGRYNTSVAYWKTNLKHLQTAIEYHLFCGEKQALIVRPAKKRKSSAPASTVTKQVVIEKTDFDPTLVGSPRHDFDAGPSDEEQTVPCTPPSNSTTPASSPILAMTPVARRRIFGTQSTGPPPASPAPTVYSLYIDIYIYTIYAVYMTFLMIHSPLLDKTSTSSPMKLGKKQYWQHLTLLRRLQRYTLLC